MIPERCPVTIIKPGKYEHQFFKDKEKVFICMGRLRMTNCQVEGKLYVMGDLIAKHSIFNDLNVGGFAILKKSYCEKNIDSFLGINLFKVNCKDVFSHGKVHLQDVISITIKAHAPIKIKGKFEGFIE